MRNVNNHVICSLKDDNITTNYNYIRLLEKGFIMYVIFLTETIEKMGMIFSRHLLDELISIL